MPHKEKLKFELKEKKFTSLLKREVLEFQFFFSRQLRMTIIDCCISLKIIKKKLVVLGVVDMRQLLLNTFSLFRTNRKMHALGGYSMTI